MSVKAQGGLDAEAEQVVPRPYAASVGVSLGNRYYGVMKTEPCRQV